MSTRSNYNEDTKMIRINLWISQDLLDEVDNLKGSGIVFEEIKGTSAIIRKLIKMGLRDYYSVK